MEEHHGAVLQKNTSEQDGCASTDSHWTRWKYVLENMLQLPDVCESGGVRSCICDALTMGHSGLTKRLEVSDISRNTEQPQVGETHLVYFSPCASVVWLLIYIFSALRSNNHLHGKQKDVELLL